ncbi:RNase P/MRP, p29 subunit [Pleurotus eryngii]|uniref:Ribonuclease P protein subunit n=1 Tax=Pleurotus eryngii TaxID=5323 RepID=A0A9P6DA90_PLEER|nr:RNase P/MRP, p29 subunit [Pleurotus eryngii]
MMSTSEGCDNVVVDLYKPLPPIQNQKLKLTSKDLYTPTYVQANLTVNTDPATTYEQRVKNRQLLLNNPVRNSRVKKERLEKKTRKKDEKERIAGVLCKKGAQSKGVWRLNESQAKWNLFLPLHHLWQGYMSELLGLASPSTPSANAAPSAASMHPKLLKADFHSSIMTGWQTSSSKNPCLIGVSGIVILESENMFKVITKDNHVKLIPKHNAIFTFAVPLYSVLSPMYSAGVPLPLPVEPENDKTETTLDGPHIELDLYGNQFRFRAANRAGCKFKPKKTIEL